MKKLAYILMVLTLILSSFPSCGKKLVPSLSGIKQGKDYDSAKFDMIFVEAIKQKLLGNAGDALSYFEYCTKINPLSDAAYYQMAQILASGGDLDNSKKYVQKALSIEPGNMWYLMMMSSLFYQSMDLDSAIIYYEKAVNYFPENEKLQVTLGRLYSENSNYDKAVKIFNSLDVKLGVNETSTVLAVSNLIAAGRFKEAEEKTQVLMDQNPDEIIYNGLLAEIYQGKGEKDKALEVYNILIERNPDNPQIQLSLCDFLLTSKKYDDLFMLLNTLSLNNKIRREDKISFFARLLETDEIIKTGGERLQLAFLVLEANYKTDDIIPLLRPDLFIKMKKFAEAGLRLEEIIKSKPENYYAREKLLLVYLQKKNYVKLEKKGEECAKMFNRSFIAKLLYANGAMENKNYTVAIEELRKANILAGDDKELTMQILTMRADIYYRMKDYSEAFATFEEAMKINSEDLTIINNYAYYLAEQDMRLKDAEVMSKKVIGKERTNTAYLDTYGWILFKRGKLKAAAKVMQELISSNEAPDAEWYEHYGYILKMQKKCENAIENWNIAIKIDSTKTNLIKEIEYCKSKR